MNSRQAGCTWVVIGISLMNASAISGLRIAVQDNDVVLDWPSQAGQTFIVEYRPALDAGWITLAADYPASAAGDRTSFTHFDIVQIPPPCGGGSSGGGPLPAPSGTQAADSESSGASLLGGLSLFPWESDGRPPYPWEASLWNFAHPAPVQLESSESTQSSTTADSTSACPPPDTGFYRVVRSGVHFTGITPGQTISGRVILPVEIGLPAGSDPVLTVTLDPADENAPVGIENYDVDVGSTDPQLIWNSFFVANGNYTLRPVVVLYGGTVIVGDALTLTVANPIQVPDWHHSFGTGLPIRATIETPNAAYTITIHNDQGQLLRTLTGTAAGGVIDTFWDGLDDTGNYAISGASVEVTISYNPSLKITSWIEPNTPNAGKVVAGSSNPLHRTESIAVRQ